MNRFTGGVLAGLAATIIALGTAGPSAAQTPQKGGTLTFAISGGVSSLDCHAQQVSTVLWSMAPAYSTLVRYDPDHYPNLLPDLALSWSEAADHLSFTFKLRPNVKFHDGGDFTSADVKATYDRLRAPPPGVTSVRAGLFSAISSIDTPDPLTAVFRLSKPSPIMMLAFSNPYNCVYSARSLAKDPKYPENAPMGTGPFKFVEQSPGVSVTYVRNDNYYMPDRPYLDGAKAVFLAGAGFNNALTGGQVDAAFASVTPTARDTAKAARGDKVKFVESPFNVTNMFEINNNRPPLNDVRVRQALNLAMDRRAGDTILQKVYAAKGFGILFPPGEALDMSPEEMMKLPGYRPDMAANRAEAKKLLDEAGIKDLHLDLLSRNSGEPFPTLAVFAIDMLRQIGVTLTQRQLETGPYTSGLVGGNFDLAIDTNSTNSSDPNEVLVKFLPNSPNNYTGVKDPMLQDLYDRQSMETDLAKRKALVTQFQTRVIEQAYLLPMFRSIYIGAYNANIMGIHPLPNPPMNADLRELWIAK